MERYGSGFLRGKTNYQNVQKLKENVEIISARNNMGPTIYSVFLT